MTSCAWRATGRRASCGSTCPWPSASTCCCRPFPLFTQRYPEISLEVRFNDRYVDIAAEARRRGRARGQGPLTRPHRQAHFGLAAAHLRVAQVPRAPACRARPKICASTASSATCAATPTAPADWQFSKATAPASLRLPMALSFNTVEALPIVGARGPGHRAAARPAGRQLSRRGPARGSAARALLRGPAAQRGLSDAPPSTSPRCACSPSSPRDLMRNYEARMRRQRAG